MQMVCRSPINFLPLLALLLLVAGGCAGDDKVTTEYGRVRGASINGVSVLAGMYRQAGCDVDTWHMLSPRAKNADCIVWAPDRFSPPTKAEREWFEEWLQDPAHTLVYIGRDYDAESDYWTAAGKDATAAQQQQLARKQAIAQSKFAAGRAAIGQLEHCDWFIRRRRAERGRAKKLSSPHSHWQYDIDLDKTSVAKNSEIIIPTEANTAPGKWNSEFIYETLLADGKEPLVLRIQGADEIAGQIIVAPNGSFLLNWPLVKPQNRRLAGKLIDECMPASSVMFIESQYGGLTINDRDITHSTGLEAFTVWPDNVILLHAMALGILFCYAWWPIFGRRRELPAPPRSDFHKHIEALGKLLRSTGDAAYAAKQIEHYHRHVRRDSGVSHADPETADPETADPPDS